jgi:molybdopterin molybdotransferase
MLSVEEARDILLGLVCPMPAEKVGLLSCVGRVLAQDVVSDIDIAPFANSAMDGFAFRHEDAAHASPECPVTLAIVGIVPAGSVFEGVLAQGQAVRIMTGAPIPDGADTVARIEDCEVLGESAELPQGAHVRLLKPYCLGAHVRPSGEDARAGDVLLRAGDVITPAGIGLLASTGNTEVLVHSRPHLAVFATGSELVDPDAVPGPGQIRNSNSHALAAYALQAGALVSVRQKVQDSFEALVDALRSAADGFDFIVLSGGAAEGDFDYTTAAIKAIGEVFYNKVCMRPGKAQTLGIVNGVPVFGLPGNPAAAAVGFEVLVRPALRKMQGLPAGGRPVVQARLSQAVPKKEPRRHYLRAHLSKDEDGGFSATPVGNQSSALFSALNESNCLIVVPEGDASLAAGDLVGCICTGIPEGEVV